MTDKEPDLRDEIQYLRELVDRLLHELAEARQPTAPPVILPAPPQKIIIKERPIEPWWKPWMPYGYGDTWTTGTDASNKWPKAYWLSDQSMSTPSASGC